MLSIQRGSCQVIRLARVTISSLMDATTIKREGMSAEAFLLCLLLPFPNEWPKCGSRKFNLHPLHPHPILSNPRSTTLSDHPHVDSTTSSPCSSTDVLFFLLGCVESCRPSTVGWGGEGPGGALPTRHHPISPPSHWDKRRVERSQTSTV